MSAPCPICGAPATKGESPFCSARCREIDLNRWLGGAYAIPADDQSPPDAANMNDAPQEEEGGDQHR